MDSGGGAPGAPPPRKKKRKKREREQEEERREELPPQIPNSHELSMGLPPRDPTGRCPAPAGDLDGLSKAPPLT